MLLCWTSAKAFDNVHHTKLFQKLLDLGLLPVIVELLAVWYGGSKGVIPVSGGKCVCQLVSF